MFFCWRVIGAAAPAMTRRATFARKAVVAAWRLRLGHALAPAGMRGERLEFLASGVSAEIEVKTTWRRNA